MEHKFDDTIRQLSAGITRRGLWRVAVASTTGAAILRLPLAVDAKKKRRKKRKKKTQPEQPSAPQSPPQPPVFNEFGCFDVGQPCQGDNSLCCSGICEGTPESSQCVGHDSLTCTAAQDNCVTQPNPCGTGGKCFKTTGNASFCGNGAQCVACKHDPDCEAAMGPGAACVVCPVACTVTKTACMAPSP